MIILEVNFGLVIGCVVWMEVNDVVYSTVEKSRLCFNGGVYRLNEGNWVYLYYLLIDCKGWISVIIVLKM